MFKDVLKRKLEEKQISAYRLSQISDVSQPEIYRCLRGERVPNYSTLMALHKVLDFTIEELFEE